MESSIGWVRFTRAQDAFSAVEPANAEAAPGSPPKSDAKPTSAAFTIFLGVVEIRELIAAVNHALSSGPGS